MFDVYLLQSISVQYSISEHFARESLCIETHRRLNDSFRLAGCSNVQRSIARGMSCMSSAVSFISRIHDTLSSLRFLAGICARYSCDFASTCVRLSETYQFLDNDIGSKYQQPRFEDLGCDVLEIDL